MLGVRFFLAGAGAVNRLEFEDRGGSGKPFGRKIVLRRNHIFGPGHARIGSRHSNDAEVKLVDLELIAGHEWAASRDSGTVDVCAVDAAQVFDRRSRPTASNAGMLPGDHWSGKHQSALRRAADQHGGLVDPDPFSGPFAGEQFDGDGAAGLGQVAGRCVGSPV